MLDDLAVHDLPRVHRVRAFPVVPAVLGSKRVVRMHDHELAIDVSVLRPMESVGKHLHCLSVDLDDCIDPAINDGCVLQA